jgi:hypothetical protein
MASLIAWMNLIVASLLTSHFILVRATAVHDESESSSAAVYDHLPKSSSDILTKHSCRGDDVIRLLNGNFDNNNGNDDPFFRWVISARHTTWNPPGWEIALPRLINRTSAIDGVITISAAAEREDDDRYYARVFDLLNWARELNLLPVPIDIASICHKGMNSPNNMRPDDGGEGSPLSSGLPWWGHDACIEQLRSITRISSSCIDIPGIIVANPNPPMKVNNPCHLPYRLVDGAHRICLRKYLLHVAAAELAELEGTTIEEPVDDDGEVPRRMRHLRETIDRARNGFFLVLDQTTFEATLTTVDPHSSWARDKHHLMQSVTREVRLEWQAWMGRVMDPRRYERRA